MLILQGERDYQVTMEDLKGWRDALERHASVTIKSYPALNHLFLQGEGKSTPAEYQRAGHIPDAVLDDIAAWMAKQKQARDGAHVATEARAMDDHLAGRSPADPRLA